MDEEFFKIDAGGNSPLVAAAIHDGHAVRAEVERLLKIDKETRRRDEDPFTAPWTLAAGNRIVVATSRFEVDLNRPRDKAVYLRPEDSWDLDVWRSPPPDEVVERSLQKYDRFYAAVEEFLGGLADRFGKFVVLDLHSYNHRRDGPDGPPAAASLNPEINIGTGSMNRDLWAAVVDRFQRELVAFDFGGRSLDVRENVRFQGGEFPRWIHRTFPAKGCALAIEVKKTFMDEWTGKLDRKRAGLIGEAIRRAAAAVLEELG